MKIRPDTQELTIGIATILTTLGLIFYFDEMTEPMVEYGTKNYNPFYDYNNNAGIIKISILQAVGCLTLLATLIIWFIKKQISRKKIILLLTIPSILIGLMTWAELWYGSTFYYGEVRDKQGLGFPILSILFFAYPFWNFQLHKNKRSDIIIKSILTGFLFIGFYVFYEQVKEPWNL